MAISIKRNNINLYQTIAFMQQMVPEIVFCTKQYFDQKKRQWPFSRHLDFQKPEHFYIWPEKWDKVFKNGPCIVEASL